MNNSASTKNCPFCKNQIPFQSEKCPICKMTLVERFEGPKIDKQKIIDTNFKFETEKAEKITKSTSQLFIYYLNKAFKFFKRKKISIVFLVIVLLIVLLIVQSPKSTDSEKTLYNYELADKNLQKKENNVDLPNNSTTQNDLKSNPIKREESLLKPFDPSLDYEPSNDFSRIPEKYIANGKAFLKNKRYFNGLGELTIKNGSDNDAVLKLVANTIGKSVLTIYVRRNSNFTIKKIKDGNYKLYFVVGRHYDEDSQIFLQDCSFSMFEEGFPFITKDYELNGQTGIKYSTFEITLHTVVGGKALTDAITKNQFLEL